MKIEVPEGSLVLLIGPSGSGKSTFASRFFLETEVISSDRCRALVSDDETDQSATTDAFNLLHHLTHIRLAARRLTVIDATNVQPDDRAALIRIARDHHALIVGLVFNLPVAVCSRRNADRENRQFGDQVIRRQSLALRRGLRGFRREGFHHVFRFESESAVDAATVIRTKLWNNREEEPGPFDLIGDVHGCFDELVSLLSKLGYQVTEDSGAIRTAKSRFTVTHPENRRAVFLGDLVDRGPGVVDVLGLAMDMVDSGTGIAVPGNHEVKLLRHLRGRRVQVTHGLEETVKQLESTGDEFLSRVDSFIDHLVSHFVFDHGRLVVSHAGLKEEMQGRASRAVREFALYGETTGETDEYGLPVRYNWAQDYRGKATVVYGHTPVPEPEWLNKTICVDTGCVFGGKLTALRYPERELVSVPAAKVYYEPVRPLASVPADRVSAQQAHDSLLDVGDLIGKRTIDTTLAGKVVIRAGNAAAALEVLTRFAIDPRWLIYLPPTMSPSETSKREGLLEHPSDALDYFESSGVQAVVCQEKHMGSRAVVVLCRDEAAARRRFGVTDGTTGVVYSRTGRQFFSDDSLGMGVLEALRDACERSGIWAALQTDWLCLDCEIMPWSVKAQDLIDEQYEPVAAAGEVNLPAALSILKDAGDRGVDVADAADRWQWKLDAITAYRQAISRYSRQVDGPRDVKVAPFHVMASGATAHFDKPHTWHMETITSLSAASDGLVTPTDHRVVDVTSQEEREALYEWWQSLTSGGGEGIVVKPRDFVTRHQGTIVQPALKCRGPEYLRIIYGPEYLDPESLSRLRRRRLNVKRALAGREFALGVEGLQRFVNGDPLRRVHECVAGVLAMESEPVDPRL